MNLIYFLLLIIVAGVSFYVGAKSGVCYGINMSVKILTDAMKDAGISKADSDKIQQAIHDGRDKYE